MKPLLNCTDSRYLKRLVREVNGTPDGVYWQGTRCNRARLVSLPLSQIKSETVPTFQIRNITGNWFTPTVIDNIVDAYGRNVCASRVP